MRTCPSMSQILLRPSAILSSIQVNLPWIKDPVRSQVEYMLIHHGEKGSAFTEVVTTPLRQGFHLFDLFNTMKCHFFRPKVAELADKS